VIVQALVDAPYRFVLAALTVLVNVALVALVVAVLLAVAVRYFGLWPGSLQWTTEFSRFTVIWIVMLGAAIGLHKGAHMAIDVGGLLPAPWRRPVRSLGYLTGIAFLAVLTWQGFLLSMGTMRQISPALGLPMGYAYLAIPVGAGLMTVQSILFALWPDLAERAEDSPMAADQSF
jgi:TRAP-type C4-dicarboxylate transport system permease small subunit